MPPTPPGTVRLQLNWSIEDGQEIGVTSLMGYVLPAPDPQEWSPDAQALADAVGAKLLAAWPSLSSSVSTHAFVKELAIYPLSPVTGLATDKGSHIYGATDCKGAGAGELPPILSPVVQLWAYPPTGYMPHARRGHGRIFQPAPPSGAYDNLSGQVDNSYASQLAEGWRQIIKQVDGTDAGGNALYLSVYSRVDRVHRQIVATSCAKLFGVQRRRQNALVRTRTTPQLVSD